MRGEFRVRWVESYRYSLIVSRNGKSSKRTTSMDSLKPRQATVTIGRTTTALRKTKMLNSRTTDYYIQVITLYLQVIFDLIVDLPTLLKYFTFKFMFGGNRWASSIWEVLREKTSNNFLNLKTWMCEKTSARTWKPRSPRATEPASETDKHKSERGTYVYNLECESW